LFVGAHLGKGGGLALQSFQLFLALQFLISAEYLCLGSPGIHSSLTEQPGVMVAGDLQFPKGVAILRDALREVRDDYDLFQIIDPYYGLPAAYLARVSPRVVNLGTDPRAEIGWRFGRVAGALTRMGMRPLLSEGVVVVNSQTLAERFRYRHPRVIRNGVDIRKFEQLPSKTEARRSRGLPQDRTILAFVGKVIPVKRIEWILEVVRRTPGALAVVVGGYTEPFYRDAYYRRLQARYPNVLDRVIFTGEVLWPEVAEYLAAADIFLFPSRFEGLPNAVMEAMASGLPVVASDIPPHHELIQHGRTGFLASDSESMADHVGELIRDPRLRSEIGESGRRFVQGHLTADLCTKAYLDLYQSVVNGNEPPAPTLHTSLDV